MASYIITSCCSLTRPVQRSFQKRCSRNVLWCSDVCTSDGRAREHGVTNLEVDRSSVQIRKYRGEKIIEVVFFENNERTEYMNQKPVEILVPAGGALTFLGYCLPWYRDSFDSSTGFYYAQHMPYLWIPFITALVFLAAYLILFKQGKKKEWQTITKIGAIASAIFIGYRILILSNLGGLRNLETGMFLVIFGVTISVAGAIGSSKSIDNPEEQPEQSLK